jgi:hypothetical protein
VVRSTSASSPAIFGSQPHPVREAWRSSSARVRPLGAAAAAVYVVRKTKREVIEMITAWAALESMAAR